MKSGFQLISICATPNDAWICWPADAQPTLVCIRMSLPGLSQTSSCQESSPAHTALPECSQAQNCSAASSVLCSPVALRPQRPAVTVDYGRQCHARAANGCKGLGPEKSEALALWGAGIAGTFHHPHRNFLMFAGVTDCSCTRISKLAC